ncbi:MAG: hypothetical protein ACLRSW_03045 [Christensenellaceae bacterium]
MHATFVGGASEYDIAVLEVQGSEVLRNSSAEEAVVGSSDAVVAGEVFAVGNAEGEGISVTSGAISVDSEYPRFSLFGRDGFVGKPQGNILSGHAHRRRDQFGQFGRRPVRRAGKADRHHQRQADGHAE